MKHKGFLELMTVKLGIGKSAKKANDEIAALATELAR